MSPTVLVSPDWLTAELLMSPSVLGSPDWLAVVLPTSPSVLGSPDWPLLICLTFSFSEPLYQYCAKWDLVPLHLKLLVMEVVFFSFRAYMDLGVALGTTFFVHWTLHWVLTVALFLLRNLLFVLQLVAAAVERLHLCLLYPHFPCLLYTSDAADE